MFAFHLARACAVAAVLALPPYALACDPDRAQRQRPAQRPAVTPGPQEAAGLGRPAPASTLAQARGGAEVTNNTTLGGTVTGNSAAHVVTGANIIQSGSFADMSGMPIVVQNSGANVLIQNATVINLQLK
jgi:hypothetical protein